MWSKTGQFSLPKFVYLLVSTPLLYDFYNYRPEVPQYAAQLGDFLQSVAQCGALLFFWGMKSLITKRQLRKKKKDLISVYKDKVKGLVKKLLALDGVSERSALKISFGRDLLKMESFLFSLKMGANSIFWSRALNLPLPHSYVFPQIQEDIETTCPVERSSEVKVYCINMELRLKIFIYFGFISGFEGHENDNKVNRATSTSKQEETVWVEGFLPGIDFCNHDLMAVATWEVHVPKIYNEQITDLLDPNQRNLQVEWILCYNFGKGSGTAGASDVPISSVEANAHS
ncbi:SET domain-containing protein isoform 4 [Hibiscus syriacus]|uniref:SET domain-containing protein isoform 4 n=1 Tax=Hibiscus syriacus TaxID=106335 RepID=A0A6A3C3B7_HIBSY|nr:SET domain-containing protein isoform 4 [Hibiscus syriacus]